jgi:hypothetical protein
MKCQNCCEHKNLKYCKECDGIKCEDCGKEWKKETVFVDRWNYYTTPQIVPYQPPYYNCGDVPFNGTVTCGNVNNVTSGSV